MPSWRPIKITAHRKEKEKAKKKEDAERTKNVTGIPEGTIRKAGPDETALPLRQRETHTRPRREKDKCAVAQTSDYLNIQMQTLSPYEKPAKLLVGFSFILQKRNFHLGSIQ